MNKLIEKYKDYPFNEEFPNLYMVVLYESGGDFWTHAKRMGYNDWNTFEDDWIEAEKVLISKFNEQ